MLLAGNRRLVTSGQDVYCNFMPGEILDNRGRGIARWKWPSVHPEGRKFALISAAICGAFALLGWSWVAWPLVGITIWVLAFFRNPERVTPRDASLIMAPADGLITLIQPAPWPKELGMAADDGGIMLGKPSDEMFTRVSIFMSVFDVHINRAPIAGTVSKVVYIPGKFLNADLDKASEDNERQHFLIERADGIKVAFTQIAGLVARRIVPFSKPGDLVEAGERVGLIRFGSRVDVYLPQGTEPRVLKGQRTVAGETVLACIGETALIEGIQQ